MRSLAWRSWILLALVLTAAAAGAKEEPTPAVPAFDWTGVWAVFDEGVDLVNLAVAADGTVASTRASAKGDGAEVGRWEATEDALFVRYESGRGETILRHTSGFRHVARREDAGSGERSTRVASAFHLTSRTVPYVGAWRTSGEGGPSSIVLRSDGTSERLSEPRASGVWRVADAGAVIRWQDGSEETFEPTKNGVRRAAPSAPAPSKRED